ncbi:tyrosine-type recombinase/integrase [Cellulophaga sp. Hel_I_12]|uniref:tyrosine-type recombinase/integrase n=1 Tax=Cellulophaga sp. Hel_I_12 TaxID=1249972 RepID=UPI000646DD03|nr:tyrosine-type recombinase/integrase [Cellulophaga sp. Hel_I_12]
MSIASFVEYLSLEKKYATNTVKAYQDDLLEFDAYCRAEFGVHDIENNSYAEIRSWVVVLVGTKISNRSINRKIASLKAFYKFLLKIDAIQVHPLAKHKSLKTPKKIEIPFSESEMEKIIQSISFPDDFTGLRDKLMIELFYSTGIRRAELVNLTMSNLDLSNSTLKVIGKRNKERILPIVKSLKILFESYLEQRAAVLRDPSIKFVFLTKTGDKVYEMLVYRVVNHYFSKVSTKVKKSPHILRHTFATHLLNKGADLNSVKELLGHASLASTQVYTHNSIAELKKVHLASHPRNQKKE